MSAPKVSALWKLAGIVGVEHDQRVQVAVAGVEDVGDLQAAAVGHLLDAARARRGNWLVGMVPSMHR